MHEHGCGCHQDAAHHEMGSMSDTECCDTDTAAERGHTHGRGAGCGCGGRRRGGGGPGGGAMTEPAVLAVLLRDGGHGYDLRRSIDELTGQAVSVDSGGLYRTLRRLEADGFVGSTWVEGETGPQRRTYELNDEGRELAQDWAGELRSRASMSTRLADLIDEGLGRAGDAR